MDLKKLVEAIDAQVLSGDIIGAFETFAGDQCITFSTTDDITHSKGQKSEALRWFFSNVASINSIERLAMAVVGENETHSQFKFDFTNNQGQPLVYSEVIRRVWKNGKLVEEQYLFGQTITAVPAKKAKADAIAAPAAAPAKKAAAPKKAAPAEKPAPAAAKKVVAPEKAAPAKVAPAKKEVVVAKTAPVKAVAPKKETVKTETVKKAAAPKAAAKKAAPKAGKK